MSRTYASQNLGRHPPVQRDMSMDASSTSASSAEVEVAKAILLREEYIHRVKANIRRQGAKFGKDRGAFDDLISLLDLVRSATIDVAEAIEHWRKGQGQQPEPFTWRGMNYLLKIPIDLDFLDSHKVLQSWLGFCLKRNPLLVPVSLERLAGSPGLTPSSGENVFSVDKKGFTDVGGVPRRASKRATTPLYDHSASTTGNAIGGSAIADGDMLRVRAAAALIVHEETMHGRFTVDCSARFVPVNIAEIHMHSHNLSLDDYRETPSPARVPKGMAPFIDMAARKRGPAAPAREYRPEDSGNLIPHAMNPKDPSSGGLPTSGKANAKRAGGNLGPVTMTSTPSARRRPVRRSVGAILGAEMVHKKYQNQQLQQELQHLRKRLSAAQRQSTALGPPDDPAVASFTDDEEDLATPPVGYDDLDQTGLQEDTMESLEAEAVAMKRKAEELERKARQHEALEEQYHQLRSNERDSQNRKRAMVLERKRRLLERDADVLQPGDNDEYTLEDQAATQLQRISRGIQDRERIRRLRPILNNAATAIQGIMRGHLDRSYAGRKRIEKRAVTDIQRVWRGHIGRCALKSNRLKQERSAKARDIQRIARGRQGRRRVAHKRGLRESGKRGLEVVGVKQLFRQDIIELADAIGTPLEDGVITSLPTIVLGLLKVVGLMLEEDEDSGATTRYSALGVQSVEKVQPAVRFSWRDALSLLRRSSKLLRRLRQVAEAPASKRPRIVHFSHAAVQTYQALRCDHGWNVETIGLVGGGAKACQHLMMWVDALQEVFACQCDFAGDFGTDRAPWIARAQQSMRCMRQLEMSRMVCEHAVKCLQKIVFESREVAPRQSESVLHGNNTITRRGDLRLCVAQRALDIVKERETLARDTCEDMKRQEENAQRDDEAREQLLCEELVADLKSAQADLEHERMLHEEAQKEAQAGIEIDPAELQLYNDKRTTCEIVRKERWTSLEMLRTQRIRNAKWKGVKIEVWEDLRHQVGEVGEMEAASILASQDLKFVRDKFGSSGDEGSADISSQEMESLETRAKEAQSTAAAAQMRLHIMEEDIENAYSAATEAELQKEENVLPREWDTPTEEEREEDLREDEKIARWEAQTASQFLPPAMIVRTFQRPRPIIVCLSRDVPAAAKLNIVNRLQHDLSGAILHIDKQTDMGLHVRDLQQALSARFNAVCNVDIGIGERCRKSFLQRLATVKDALMPTPTFVLVVGDKKNRSGGPLDTGMGCSDRDLTVAGDGEMKRRLEDIAWIVEEIRGPAFLAKLASMALEVSPPSDSHLIVLEAVMILLTPQVDFENHAPMSPLRGVTWAEARHILGNPDKMWAAIARVDANSIPPANICTLQGYLRHDRWPRTMGVFACDDVTLNSLAAWARSTIEFSSLLTDAGGCPKDLCPYSTATAGLLAAVVPVHDEEPRKYHGDGNEEGSINVKRGWKAAYSRILLAVLEDVRVFRVAKNVQGASPSGVRLIEIYQECGRLFFHVYDPEFCTSSFCDIEEWQISPLLAPALDQPPEFGPSTVPRDRQDLFARLVGLLSFETHPQDTVEKKRLTCKRRLRRLLRDTRYLDGHLAQLVVYEEAKGELRCSVYLAHHSARIQLKVNAEFLERVLQDCGDGTRERQAIESEDSDRLLVPITDRLEISPSRTVVATMGVGHGASRKKTPSQGFSLKLRCKGGPGRRVLRTVCCISGSSHVVTAWELGRGGTLRLAAYDPATSMTYEAQLSKVERACCGFDGEACKSWTKRLGRRLSLRRAVEAADLKSTVHCTSNLSAKRTMVLDRTVFSTACRIAAGRMDSRLIRLRARLVDDGRVLELDLYQSNPSKNCTFLLTVGDLVGAGLRPLELNSVPAGRAISDEKQTEGIDICPERGFSMASMFVGAASREAAIRHIVRQLRFASDSDSVTLSIGGGSRNQTMVTSQAAEKRRPQCSVSNARVHGAVQSGSHAPGRRGLTEGFSKTRRQPGVLLYSGESARPSSSQEAGGSKRMPDSVSRHSPKRDKGKQKRAKKPPKQPANMNGNDNVRIPEIADRGQPTFRKSGDEEEPIGHSTYVNDFIGGTAPVCLPRQGECQIFARAVSIRKDDWESHQPVCDTVVTVFASSPSGAGDGGADKDDGVCLRAVVYYTKMAAYAEVTIKDFIDLRQVVGALHQPLAHEWRHQGHNDGTAAEALFYFIFRHRAIVALGVWDDSIGAYVEHGAGFTVVLKRSRLYSSVKQTPIHLRGEQDAQANIGHLIDDASRRGTKVFRRAVNVSTTLFQITVYELPPPEGSREIAPTLKFIAYDSKTRKQLVAVVCPDAVLELGGGESSPWMAQEKRETLAGILVQALRLKISQDGSPTLMMPWSGENLVFLDEALPGETSRPRRDKARACAKREGLSRLDVFSTRVTGFEVVITVFVETDQSLPVPATKVEDEDADQPTLIFNLYCPKLSKSADVDLPHAMQKIMTGKNILHFPTGMARSTAIRRTTRFLCINQPTASKQLHAEFILKENKPWLVAYNELDPSDRPSAQRPHGQPLIFIPGDTVGDPITSEGIDISGLKVLLSVYSKDKGRPGREGLVWEVYNQETCARCILHLSSSRLLEQVDNKDYLCEDSRLVETIHALTKRLVLKKAATGGWDLRLDRTIKPWMFCGL